ncbi:hypothetical protein ACQW02_07260 [Humitalea sp. 24SJ18S-53]|uniref:hypothetical protein n=1 Tax=Humitalea sp. 24SJ18S-53 TaxID=3422307 RepID=UPI003D66C76B
MSIDAFRVFEEDTLLVRFSRFRKGGFTLGREDHMNSPWWLTIDMFTWLMGRAHASARGTQAVVREQLLLPPEWTDADCFVRAFPKPGIHLGAWFGKPRTVYQQDKHGPAHRWTAARGQPETFMYQLFVPGLGARPAVNARNWLEFEGLYSLVAKPGRRGQAVYPCMIPGKQHGA